MEPLSNVSRETLEKESRVFGPPGTGKTTYLCKQIKAAAEVFGEERLLVSSFSRAAAYEIAARSGLGRLPQVGTLHSIAYGAIGSPEIAETRVADWNKTYPSMALPDANPQGMETGEVSGQTSENLLNEYNLIRSKGIEMCNRCEKGDYVGHVNPRLGQFITRWEEWKKSNELFDYTDLLAIAYEDFDEAPTHPSVGFFDEVQDFNPLMMELVRKWSSRMDRTILCGDDDQTIYSFMGSTPDAFLNGIPREEIVLSKSFRLPDSVLRWSTRWIQAISRRKEKQFRSRGEEGAVEAMYRDMPHVTARTPSGLADMMEVDLAAGRTVMLLASCAYMLTPATAELKRRGVPFHNHYRPSYGWWNPLPPATAKRTPAWKRLRAFLSWKFDEKRTWSVSDFYLWREHIAAKNKDIAPGLLKHSFLGVNALETPLRPAQLMPGHEFDVPWGGDEADALRWFYDALTGSSKKSYDFPIACVRHGYGKDMESPRVCVGTIHSVKGGEADAVYLLPDLSSAQIGDLQHRGQPARDALTRLFYVGATRAREKLVLVGPVARSASVQLRI